VIQARRPLEFPFEKEPACVSGVKDHKVIRAFVDRKPATGLKLDTDGQCLDGTEGGGGYRACGALHVLRQGRRDSNLRFAGYGQDARVVGGGAVDVGRGIRPMAKRRSSKTAHGWTCQCGHSNPWKNTRCWHCKKGRSSAVSSDFRTTFPKPKKGSVRIFHGSDWQDSAVIEWTVSKYLGVHGREKFVGVRDFGGRLYNVWQAYAGRSPDIGEKYGIVTEDLYIAQAKKGKR
jgi:hypothetical protein